MSFLYPLFLAGALAIAIPIVLHLLRRDVAPEVPFTAVRLLRRSPVEQTRRKRLRDLLLLLARVAALLLLAAAFARPYFAAAAAARRPCASSRSIVRSAWARPAAFSRRRRWRAKRSAAAGSAQVAVIAFDDRATVVARRVVPARRVLPSMPCSVGYGATRYGPLFARVQELAGSQPAQLVIVSDLQRAGWSEEAPPSVRPGIDVDVRQVPAAASNLAVASVRRTGDGVVVTVVNGGGEAASGTARISVDRQEVASSPFSAPAGSSVDVPVRYRRRRPRRAHGRSRRSGRLPGGQHAAAAARSVEPHACVDRGRRRPRIRLLCRARAAVGRRRRGVRRGRAAGSVSCPRLESAAGARRGRRAALDPRPRSPVARHHRRIRPRRRRPAGGGLRRRRAGGAGDDDGMAGFQRGGARPSRRERWRRPTCAIRSSGRSARWRRISARGASTGRGPCGPTGGTCWRGSRMGRRRSWSGGKARGRVVLFASDLSRRWNDFPLNPAFVPFAIETVRHTAGASDRRRDYVVAEAPDGRGR